jgi:hypothetical protein
VIAIPRSRPHWSRVPPPGADNARSRRVIAAPFASSATIIAILSQKTHDGRKVSRSDASIAIPLSSDTTSAPMTSECVDPSSLRCRSRPTVSSQRSRSAARSSAIATPPPTMIGATWRKVTTVSAVFEWL